MVIKFYLLSRKLHTLVNISKSNLLNMNKCYFRYIPQDNKIDINFLFKAQESLRQFNFNRKPTETVEILCSRIATNVQKAIKKKKKKSQDELELQVKIYDWKNNAISEKVTCLELFDIQEPLKLKVHSYMFDIFFNAPWVVSMNLPKSILACFPIYIENFETHYTNQEDSVFNWYKGACVNEKGNEIADIHVKWQFITNTFSYTPKSDDIGMKLKLECIPGNSAEKCSTGPAFETISKGVVEAGPGPCPFETRHIFTSDKLKYKSFRCVSYNILADLYCDSDFTRTVLHPYCPPYALQIDYRKQLVLKELLGYNADIICLQEVDSKVFLGTLKPCLNFQGLEGCFYKKGKTVAEGLACFFKKDRFTLVKESKILLSEAIKTEACLKPIWDLIQDSKNCLNRLLDRSTIASATILQSNDNPTEIVIVGNTHLYFHPDADHIRLIQGGMVIYWLQNLRNTFVQEMPDKRISIILCGDFNSVPSCGIYQLYTTGSAPSSLPDWKSNTEEAVSGVTLNQSLSLESACGTPQYTNFTVGFADCLDYIFYDKQNIQVQQVVPFPSLEELTAHTALPSIVFPSDHIAIVSDLEFK